MKGLKEDSKKLDALVTKYDKIHDEGAGRRLLFTLKESGGLVDLRRRIGLHEQILQMWYMTLVYGSLRRLEGGQEHILRAIEAMKGWSPRKVEHVQRSLRKGDVRTLERELSKSGLRPQEVDAALGTAVDYVDAAPLEKVRMESHARSSSTVHPEASSFRYPDFSFDSSFDDTHRPFPPPPHEHHRKASGRHKPSHSSYWTDEGNATDMTPDELQERLQRRNARLEYETLRAEKEKLMKREELMKKERRERRRKEEEIEIEIEIGRPQRRNASPKSPHTKPVNLTPDFGRPRSHSQTISKPIPPPSTPSGPLLLIPPRPHHHRPASYHDPSDRYERRRRSSAADGGHDVEEQFVTIQQRAPTHQRHRSVSREIYPAAREKERDRDRSTHSYDRRRSGSRRRESEGEGLW